MSEVTLNEVGPAGGIFTHTDHQMKSRYPYLCADTFQSVCHHHYPSVTWSVQKIQAHQLIFIHPEHSSAFFVHQWPKINVPISLLSHRNDLGVSCFVDKPRLQQWLNDPKLQRWYMLYPDPEFVTHPKCVNLPLGIAYWNLIDSRSFEAAVNYFGTNTTPESGPEIRCSNQVFCCWNNNNNPGTRCYALECLRNNQLAKVYRMTDFSTYLATMRQFTWVASPMGHGWDCFRTWEALYCGCFPIVVSHPSLDSLYEQLPVLIVQDWSQVTAALLQEAEPKMKEKQQRLFRLPTDQRPDHADFYIGLIQSQIPHALHPPRSIDTAYKYFSPQTIRQVKRKIWRKKTM